MKSLKLVSLIVAALLISTLTGCVGVNLSSAYMPSVVGKGDLVSYTINVGKYNAVNMSLYCNIVYKSAPSDTVTLEIQSNLRDYVVIEENRGTLVVRSTANISITDKPPVLTISTPDLERVSLSGAGKFTTVDAITSDSFDFALSGAGTGDVDLDVGMCSIMLSGTGTFNVSGKAGSIKVNLSGAGSLDALDLQAGDAEVDISGAGIVRVNCTDYLSIDAAGVGTVEYKGDPKMNMNTNGLVTVRKVN